MLQPICLKYVPVSSVIVHCLWHSNFFFTWAFNSPSADHGKWQAFHQKSYRGSVSLQLLLTQQPMIRKLAATAH